jgi:peptidase A4-like protein
MSEQPRRPDPREQRLIERMEAALRPRLHFSPQPPEGFDPLAATAEELDTYGLPPRPDPDIHRDAYSLWRRVLSPPLTILRAVFPTIKTVDYRITGYGNKKQKKSAAMSHQETTRLQTSSNWSGASIAANGRGPFTMAFGLWRVPEPRHPTGQPDGDYRCSTWVGLDGLRRHSRSLPQLGTTQSVLVAGGTQTKKFEAWYQWWIRGQHFAPVPFPDFSVDEGDLVACILIMLTPVRARFVIKNLTQSGGPLSTVDLDVPSVQGVPPSEHAVRGGNAEWIAERPMHIESDQLYPLADYASVTFDPCLALVPAAWRDLRGARLLRMIEVRESPHRAAIISSARKVLPTQYVVEARYRYEGT